MLGIHRNSTKIRIPGFLAPLRREIHATWNRRRLTTAATTLPPLAEAYQPQRVEADYWLHQSQGRKTHVASSQDRRCPSKDAAFRMILPPPNVTGNLHLGHALMATIQDVICRHHRQLGYDVEWIPGTDHAGIATQVVVEKKVMKEQGLTRQQLGREAFMEEVWKWKNEKGKGIIEDLVKLGCTLDWDEEYFTMDHQRALAVRSAFVRLFDEGLIRHQKSLVNWSCALESAISDMEVESMEIKGPTSVQVPGYDKDIQFGRLYNIIYRVMDSDEQIVVATTRPETLLGDVAVAVHPEDERYMRYRPYGKEVKLWHPFRQEPIPLVFDVKVDKEFGNGAVKITPAHDKFDFELAQRHLLEPLPVFTERGTISKQYEEFKDLLRFQARERIVDALASMQLLHSVKDHEMVLPICSRSKDVVEYMLRPQWFLHCQPLAEAAASEVRSGRLHIIPEDFETEWFRWLDNCQDWCISRQLWWGHRIPAYLAKDLKGNSCWVAALDEKEAEAKALQTLNTDSVSVEQDTDVLDTWFSSALLPFSAFNWPGAEYKDHYPLSLMETGHDILFFWVARMVMLGLKLTGESPFKKILLNGIICDAHGRKMSKSLGNVVTPQQVVQGTSLEAMRQELLKSYNTGSLSASELKRSEEGLERMFPKGIEECGTDALRFTLCSHNIKTHFINFDVAECVTNKRFLNKIWQATRYTLQAAERLQFELHELETMNNVELGKWDRWILSRLCQTFLQYSQGFKDYNFHLCTAALKQFFYTNLCDVYLETTKANVQAQTREGFLNCATLATCLSWGLQAMAPFTPFVTEVLMQHVPRQIDLNLNKFLDSELEQEIADILQVVECIRQVKSRNKISRKHEPTVHLLASNEDNLRLLQTHLREINALSLTHSVQATLDTGEARRGKQYQFTSTAGHLCSFGILTNDSYKQQEESNLNAKKLLKLEKDLAAYRQRVASEGFRKSASAAVQQKHQEKIKKLETEIKNIKDLASWHSSQSN